MAIYLAFSTTSCSTVTQDNALSGIFFPTFLHAILFFSLLFFSSALSHHTSLISTSPRLHSFRSSLRNVAIGQPVLASQAWMSDIMVSCWTCRWTQRPAPKRHFADMIWQLWSFSSMAIPQIVDADSLRIYVTQKLQQQAKAWECQSKKKRKKKKES